jgi:hypothetical protein
MDCEDKCVLVLIALGVLIALMPLWFVYTGSVEMQKQYFSACAGEGYTENACMMRWIELQHTVD